MSKTAKEMEQEIIQLLREQKAEYDEHDKWYKEWKADEIARGTSPDFFEDEFYFNGYIYANDVHNIVAYVLFGTNAYKHFERNKYHGTYDKNLLTKDQWEKVNLVEKGMVDKGIIKPSKSGAMAKVLV